MPCARGTPPVRHRRDAPTCVSPSGTHSVHGVCRTWPWYHSRPIAITSGGLSNWAFSAADVLLDQLVLDDVAVDLGQRRVAVGDPTQGDDELQQIRVRLLPERFLRFPEQVVQQAADRVRDRRTDRDRCAAGCSRRRCRGRFPGSRASRPAACSIRCTWRQKSPFTSSTSPPTLRSASRALHRRSWSTYGYMQAEVLPVPTAPRIMTPV